MRGSGVIAVSVVALVASSTVVGSSRASNGSGAAPTPVPPKAVPIAGRCVVAGGVALLLPHNRPLALGPVVTGPAQRASNGVGAAYPADGSVASFSTLDVATAGCRQRNGPSANVSLTSLSLLGGAVTAESVSVGPRGKSTIVGLAIGGAGATVPTKRVQLSTWGYLQANVVDSYANRLRTSALAITLVRPYLGLPAGAVIVVGFVDVAHRPAAAARVRPARHAHRAHSRQRRVLRERKTRPHTHRRQAHRGRNRRHQRAQRGHWPLKVTPRLGLRAYVFPVAGAASFSDTYGAFRGDVSGGWHHGDDVFAPLGTPVVAVATGTLNRVGWERIGGWRLWVRDRLGNEFYYAHLSGYTPLALRSKRVQAGQVLGFVGNTGDAFTTPAHLHFEIHPRSLLHLHYDGAVDPTSYLEGWRRLNRVRAPRPAHPSLAGADRREASYVFRELLIARGLMPRRELGKRPSRVARARLDAPAQFRARSRLRPSAERDDSREAVTPSLLAASLAFLGVGALFLVRRRVSP